MLTASRLNRRVAALSYYAANSNSRIRVATSPHLIRLFAAKAKKNSKDSVSESDKYERKTPHEHVLLRPGMYVGQMDPSSTETWIFDDSMKAMEKRTINYSPALIKIFDEILVNAADNRQRDKTMSKIDISVESTSSNGLRICVENDGLGIPVELHATEKIYIPELIFGHLLTGSNFDDSESRLSGGRHGYGAKLTNIFSTSFELETGDSKRGLVYKQQWSNNMLKASAPSVEKTKLSRDFTKITFEPDLPRFGVSIDDEKVRKAQLTDAVKMFQRRALDIAACISPVKVTFNGERLAVKSFQDYVELFAPSSTKLAESEVEADEEFSSDGEPDPIFYTKVNDRWEIAVKKSTTGVFEQMSFTNAVWTPRGGSHVALVANQIQKALEDALQKKSVTANAATVRSKLMVFVNCSIENPSFDSQSKDTLTSRPSTFGSSCDIPQTFLKKVVKKSGIIDDIMLDISFREQQKLLRAAANTKKKSGNRVIDVPKLEDAHLAGTDRAHECTLILTEGDSAKALAVAGLEVVGRDTYGVLPLRGKILNVRIAPSRQLAKNQELIHLCKALGLDFKKSYKDGVEGQGLRYGRVMLMCDQDNDGSHIKGLVINFFHHFWPELLEIDGFLQQFSTPLVKVRSKTVLPGPVASADAGVGESSSDVAVKGKKKTKSKASDEKSKSSDKKSADTKYEVRSFYSMPEYDAWRRSALSGDSSAASASSTSKTKADPALGKLTVKYYKGLGTNTADEGKEYFRALARHQKDFFSGERTNEAIDLAFSKARAEDRRNWLLETYDPSAFIDPSERRVAFEDFIDKELIQFSYADNQRSIPSAIDGLKPSQRKVLYGCFKRKLDAEMKVVQLAGYIAEKTCYHHGESSLHATIINMAQDFVGANNAPLLEAAGQLGTRAQGGKDFASPRYIFTRLSPIARALYPEADDSQLDYLEEDGQTVEPRYFIPVIPALLLNGSHGIGTGWSTYIPPYRTKEIAEHVAMKIRGLTPKEPLAPWVRGFYGEIVKIRKNYASRGVVTRTNKTTVEISELPYGVWTDDYKEILCRMCENGEIKSFTEDHTTANVRFVVTAPKTTLDKLEKTGLMESFKLEANISLNNMHAFNSKGKITKYETPEQILEEHFGVRMTAYRTRKESLSRRYAAEEAVALNKSKFIADIISGDLSILRTSRTGGKVAAAAGGALAEGDLIDELRSRGFANSHQIRSMLGNTENMDGGLSGLLGAPLSERDDGSSSSSSSSTSQLGADSDAEIVTAADGKGKASKGRRSERAEYAYLLDMPIQSLTEERLAALRREAERASAKLAALKAKSEGDLWLADIDFLSTKCAEQGLDK